jgi:hypothetical protein
MLIHAWTHSSHAVSVLRLGGHALFDKFWIYLLSCTPSIPKYLSPLIFVSILIVLLI